ncbi:sigma-70 family RNA polymerase sigma factor [Sphingobacterium gobiense]|uniref:RNA polymerase sigma-70 factor n=1 Tax=Sphingobacterium gobiense TaxID=1382456 RepID=A0A2S9JUE0_9SPHI|nr:sigma-70 family RNA polymerase sigma factor [Sphingobacterium gobiense]PRD56858.1 hypothetical protein C5749_06470 [Sphingobacterium gobiense]
MYFKPLSEDNKRKIAIERRQEVFKLFFVANFKVLESYARFYVKDKFIAEDIASEVMWKMWHLGSDLLHVTSIELYLLRAIKNKCLNYLRIRQAEYVGHEELADYQFLDHLNPEDIFISNENVMEIEHAIAKLPTKTQQVFRLVKDENYSYKDAAQMMGISINTVDRHIQIAIQKLWCALKKKK